VTASSSKLTREPHFHIDPGFINFRKCFHAFGRELIKKFEQGRASDNDPMAELHNNHLIVDLVLEACRYLKVQSLGQVLADPQPGQIFCSIEHLAGARGVLTQPRVINRVILAYRARQRVFLEFGTKHIQNDTGRAEQSERFNNVAVVGQVRSIGSQGIQLSPLIMGAPSLQHLLNEDIGVPMSTLAFWGIEQWEVRAEEMEEFARMKEVKLEIPSQWMETMPGISEDKVKAAFAELLGDEKQNDWGGEECDHFTSSIRVKEKVLTAAFAFKGPAGGSKFKPMTLKMLGKNGDQIYRLAKTPANLLILQHCHQIEPAVRETLQRFAVTPQNPRRYCLIDGKETYCILKAYGKL
jgi:hypothetical protein